MKSALPSLESQGKPPLMRWSRTFPFSCHGVKAAAPTVGIIGKILILSLLLSIFITPCLAQGPETNVSHFVYSSSVNYNALDNPYLQWRVKQGAVLYTGRSYDIASAIGTSDFIAHWSDWKVEDQNCQPDTIIPVTYIKSNGAVTPKNYYINPLAFPTGNYFTWDGCREWVTLVKSGDGSFTTQINYGQAPNENRFAFTVKNPRKPMVPVRALMALPIYTLPSFAAGNPPQATANSVPEADPPAQPAKWWIQWWWLELIAVGIVAYVVNDEFDIL